MPCLLLLATLTAAASPGSSGAALDAIELEGNTRTAREVVVRALGVRPGDRIDDESIPELRQRVLNLRLFREVEVTTRPSDAGVVLSVRVRERWTLIPIPIFGASEGVTHGGLALFETNLLGRHKTLAASAIVSTRGFSGFLFYRDPALLGTGATLAAELLSEDRVRERADGFDVVQAWRDRRVEGSVRAGFAVAPHLTVRAGPFAVLRESGAEPGYEPPPPVGSDLGVAADLEYEGQDYRDWFNVGPLARATLRRSLPALGSNRRFTLATAQAGWAVPVVRKHEASASVAGYLADGDPVLDAFTLGGRPGSRGVLTGGLWAERAVTATLDYELPIWRPSWGTATTLAFVDAGVAAWRGEVTRWVAPGAGVRLYVRNVALPALGLDLAWSTAGEELAPSFFVGFR